MINYKQFKKVGIIGFGAYLPYWRLETKEIAKNWQKEEKVSSLEIGQKSVASADEDSLTMAVEASLIALKRAKISSRKIGAVFVGSESHPYAVKPTGTILAEVLGMDNEYFCVDLQFACKAGTSGLAVVAAMIESGLIDYGLVVGTDKSQARPGDELEYTAAAGAAAFILGRNSEKNVYAQLKAVYSFNSDTPDFWRRQECSFPSHLGRFTGEPGYFYHLSQGIKNFFKKTKTSQKDFAYFVFHMPNVKFPLKLIRQLGIDFVKIKNGFLVPLIGNCYSACSLLGLVAVLEEAMVGKNILLASYGSGAGSDVFWWESKKESDFKDFRIKDYLASWQKIDYLSYLRNYGFLKEV